MLNITVLTGGSTPERDVALAGAAEVVRALRSRGHQVKIVDIAMGPLSQEQGSNLLNPAVDRVPPSLEFLKSLGEQEDWLQIVHEPTLRDADLIFPLLHGREVEGGLLQSLLEVAGLRFVGSDMRGSLLAMDKDLTKQLCQAAGIPTADWVKWPAADADIAPLGFPLIVKPARAGSTVGLSLVESAEQLPNAIQQALTVDSEVLLERFIVGRELTVGILGDQAPSCWRDYSATRYLRLRVQIHTRHESGNLSSGYRTGAARTHHDTCAGSTSPVTPQTFLTDRFSRQRR